MIGDVLAGWAALGLSIAFALFAGPRLDRRLRRLEDSWENETGARCSGRSVQRSDGLSTVAGRRA